MSYELSAPPVVADLQAHARAITSQAFSVSHRTLGDWPISTPLVNGKRQPRTAEVWAFALAVMGDADLEAEVIQRMAQGLRADVEVLLPSAREAKALRNANLKGGRGAHLRTANTAA